MTQDEFIIAYESGLATQDWKNLDALISDNIAVTFSDGSVYTGRSKVKAAFEKNFNSIKSEKYSIENVNWLKKEESYAVYIFEYHWSGLVKGNSVSGQGVGTSVIIKENGDWKLLTEHLGRSRI